MTARESQAFHPLRGPRWRWAAPRGRRPPRRASRRPASRSRCAASGPDVILIPGPQRRAATSGRRRSRAVPGYRYHLIQVRGFAGAPARGQSRAARSSRRSPTRSRATSQERRLRRPAIIGHSMGGTLAMMIGARHPAAGRPDHGRRHAARARRHVRRQRVGLWRARQQPARRSDSGRRLFGSLMSNLQPARFEPAHQRSRRRRADHERAGGDRPDRHRCPASARR